MKEISYEPKQLTDNIARFSFGNDCVTSYLCRLEAFVSVELPAIESASIRNHSGSCFAVEGFRPFVEEAKDAIAPLLQRLPQDALHHLRSNINLALDVIERIDIADNVAPCHGLASLHGVEDLLVAIGIQLYLSAATRVMIGSDIRQRVVA